MKKLTLYLTLATLLGAVGLLLGNLKTARASRCACTTFTLDNTTTDSLGQVTVGDGLGDNAYLDVNGSGQFQTQICFTAASVTIGGSSVPYPNTQNITLAGGAVIGVQWQSSSLIEVSNPVKVNTPIQ